MSGRVEAIYLAEERGPVFPVERAEVHAGKGIPEDRKYFPDGARRGQALTLIAMEALEAMAEENGIDLTEGGSRRQVHTREVDLNALVGRRFRVGEIECLGIELCEPCAHLESITQPGVINGLVHRGGLNADVLSDGEISVGDAVVADD